jgi:hypothetical protein
MPPPDPDGGTNEDGSPVRTMVRLVELRGLEPLTPSMRTRCATRLRHNPNRFAEADRR